MARPILKRVGENPAHISSGRAYIAIARTEDPAAFQAFTPTAPQRESTVSSRLFAEL